MKGLKATNESTPLVYTVTALLATALLSREQSDKTTPRLCCCCMLLATALISREPSENNPRVCTVAARYGLQLALLLQMVLKAALSSTVTALLLIAKSLLPGERCDETTPASALQLLQHATGYSDAVGKVVRKQPRRQHRCCTLLATASVAVWKCCRACHSPDKKVEANCAPDEGG